MPAGSPAVMLRATYRHARCLTLLLLYTLSALTFRTLPSSFLPHDITIKLDHRQRPRQHAQPLRAHFRTLMSADILLRSRPSSQPPPRTLTAQGGQPKATERSLASQYHRLSIRSPIALASAQTLLLASAANAVSQSLRGAPVELAHGQMRWDI